LEFHVNSNEIAALALLAQLFQLTNKLFTDSHKVFEPHAPAGFVVFGISFLALNGGPNSSNDGQACCCGCDTGGGGKELMFCITTCPPTFVYGLL
jgi:hypothetical protein